MHLVVVADVILVPALISLPVIKEQYIKCYLSMILYMYMYLQLCCVGFPSYCFDVILYLFGEDLFLVCFML